MKYEFKVGDKVKLLGNCKYSNYGDVTILEKDRQGTLRAVALNGREGCSCPWKWELVEEINNNNKGKIMLNQMQKKFLNAEAQILMEAGYIDSSLALTTKGKQVMESLQFDNAQKELVKLAQAEMKSKE